jgi:hypothetical protein
VVSFPQVSQPEPCAHLSPPPYAPHAPPNSFFSILPPAQYFTPKTTDINSEYVIIVARILQRLFYDRTPLLRYTYISCLVRWGFQEVENPRFQDNRHMKVVRLSALHTGRLYTSLPRKYSWYSFLLEAE